MTRKSAQAGAEPPAFDIEKLSTNKGYVVTGIITVAGVLAAETYERFWRTRREAERDAERMLTAEIEARAYVALQQADAEEARRAMRAARAEQRINNPQLPLPL